MHLTYLGDATLGDRVNIGAGTVTCNYDGKQKNETHIEDDVKIGSDTMLVAPVRVGRGSVSAAGSVIIEDVPPDTLVAGVPAKAKKKVSRLDKFPIRSKSMCGIVGYVGGQEAVPVIIEGLRRLEYRGYDSAGIAVVDEDRRAQSSKSRAANCVILKRC